MSRRPILTRRTPGSHAPVLLQQPFSHLHCSMDWFLHRFLYFFFILIAQKLPFRMPSGIFGDAFYIFILHNFLFPSFHCTIKCISGTKICGLRVQLWKFVHSIQNSILLCVDENGSDLKQREINNKSSLIWLRFFFLPQCCSQFIPQSFMHSAAQPNYMRWLHVIFLQSSHHLIHIAKSTRKATFSHVKMQLNCCWLLLPAKAL